MFFIVLDTLDRLERSSFDLKTNKNASEGFKVINIILLKIIILQDLKTDFV